MINKATLFLLFLIHSIVLLGQNCIDNKTNTWYFGNYAGLSFNTDPPTVLYDGAMTNKEGVSSISDKVTGRILFYTNGVTVWDSTNQPMPNGNSLLGRSDAEQNCIIPYPSNPSKYFLFTTTHWNGTFYSIVDMSLNNGKGDIDVTQKNIMLIGGWNFGQVRASDKITFTKHGNKKDYWMVTHITFNDSFYVYQISSNGIQSPVGFKIGANETPTNPEVAGTLKFNKAGNLLVNCQPYDGAQQSKLQGFYFNRNTGTIDSLRFSIENIWFPYSVEFSPNNQFMYVAHPIVNNIDQFDLTSSNIPASVANVYNYDPSLTRVGQLQLGNDNRIYVAQTKNYNIPYRYLGVINQPNNLGTACNFVQDAVDLFPNASFFGLPSGVCEIDEYEECAYVDTFNCKTLKFITDSSRFCVPVILPSDSTKFKDNGFHFCMSYDTNFVRPTGIYNQSYNTGGFTVIIDSVVKGKICVSISNVQHITFTNNHDIDLGCVQFVLENEPFNSIKTFDYLSFQIVDGCNNNLQTINAWLTEDNEYWETEDGKYWKLEE